MYWYEVGCDMDVRMAGDVPSCIAFGAVHEALMVGWSSGMISVYDASALGSAWSSFKAHPSAVRQLTSLGMAGTLSVSATHICMHGLAGAPYVSAQLLHSTREGRELTSVLALDTSRFVVGCNAPNNGSSLYELDLSRIESQYLHKFRGAVYDHGVDIMCRTPQGSIVCGGGTGDTSGEETRGKIGLVDLRAGTKAGNLLAAHSGGITDMDVYENKLLTCGLGPNGMTDRFVKMFDVRMLARPAGALQVTSRFVRFLTPSEDVPAPGRALFVGEMGNLCAYADVHEAVASAHMEQTDQLHSLQGIVTGMGVSPVGRAAAICDAAGCIHLWTDDEAWAHEARPNINVFSEPLEDVPPPSFAASDKRMDNLQFWDEANFDLVAQSMLSSCDVDDVVAAGHELCSDLTPLFMEKPPTEKTPREIHPDLLERAQTREGFPGQFIETTSDEFPVPQSLVFGKATSRRAYLHLHDDHHHGGGGDPDALSPPTSPGGRTSRHGTPSRSHDARRGRGRGNGGFAGGGGKIRFGKAGGPETDGVERGGGGGGGSDDGAVSIPEHFVKPRIVLSRVGPTQVDYAEFNLTAFAGLEGKLPNSYANSLIQVFYFTPELRGLVLPYVSADPKCLATEAGFLFHMLDQAQHVPPHDRVCEARNFLRAFRLAPDVQAFGLLEPSPLEADQRTAACARFMLEQFSRSHHALKDAIRQTFGVRVVTREKWLVQGLDDSQLNSHSLAVDIAYPSELSKAVATNRELPSMSFISLLRNTFNQSNKTRLWSKQKGDQIPVVQSRTATGFSDVLILNAASHENRAVYLPLFRRKTKSKGSFVKTAFRVSPASGDTTVVEAVDAAAADNKGGGGGGGGQIYDLVAVVSHISPSNHIVAHIKIPPSYAQRAGSHKDAGQWMLFNDFRVDRVLDVASVVDFSDPSRNPCLFIYRRRRPEDAKPPALPRVETTLSDKEVFHAPSVSSAPGSRSFVQLDLDKLPREGDLVAIDCEMVALSTEEFYTNSEGRKVVTQEPQLSLARVSCTREDERVFIDDYIRTPDEVVDYLTRFSGLVPGDLDPALSKHHLVPLRIAYLKLRRLVDRGCIFVGHGLRQDFHIINIFVPPEQIRDTVHLFRIPDNRMLSLSFLSSVVLQQEIQGKTHDSIEDALMALRLFKVYNKEKANNTLQETLTMIYYQGRKRNFR